MRHLPLMFLLFALPCFASMPMPDVPRPEPEKSTACMRAYCDCNAFSLAQVPELGPSSQACECGHGPAMHARELAPTFSGSTHASGSSAFTNIEERITMSSPICPTRPPGSVRAKCRVTSTKHASGTFGYSATQKEPYAIEVTLQPVYGADDDSENKSWSKYTPSGELKLVITNPDAVAVLGLGKTFYVDFTPADVPATS